MVTEEDDVFQDSSPQIVDCDVLEAAKENIQPLGTGRRVTALSAILSTPHAHREAKLSATRNRLRINVELALDDEEDGDPLEAYCRLVNWTVENYPQGHSAESGLLELLEEATRVLKDNRGGIWRADLKYLKLWLLYASYVEKPTIIYKFLIANNIGAGHALLYEEYAAVLERDGRRKEADDAYALGIARRAVPLDHLENRYNDFQKRMMSNMFLPPAPAATTTQAARTALASTSTSTSRLPSSSSSSRLPSSGSNTRLQVFVDPSGSSQSDAALSNTWTDLGTRKTRVKENVPETKKLVGSTIRQAGKSKRVASGSSSGASKIAIYRDSEPETGEVPPPPVPLPASGSAEKNGKEGAVPRTSAKGGFAVFVDKEEVTGVPATPKFTPFRDEASGVASTRIVPTTDIIKVKKHDARTPAPTTEAEALRKDPLKNYDVAAVTMEEDG